MFEIICTNIYLTNRIIYTNIFINKYLFGMRLYVRGKLDNVLKVT
jgi:hypothetical protein